MKLHQPKLKVIDSLDDIETLKAAIATVDLIAFDTETTGVHKGAKIVGISFCWDESEAYYIITHAWSNALEMLVEQHPGYNYTPLIKMLEGKQLIAHNGIFDCEMVNSNYKVSLIDSLHTDTMILAHLLNENRRVGLKDLAREYFGNDAAQEAEEMKASVISNGGVWTTSAKDMYKADSKVLGKYGAKDAWLTYMLFMELLPELHDQGLDKFFYEDESMPLLKGPTYQLNTTGLKTDQAAITSLKKQLEAECAEAKSYIYSEIDVKIKGKYPGTNKKNTFNIGSSQQLCWLLFGVYELEFGTLTESGRDICYKLGLKAPYHAAAKRDFIHSCMSMQGQVYEQAGTNNGKKVNAKKFKEPWAYIACDKKTLIKIAPKYKWVERLLEYQRKNKLLTTYIKGIEERVQYGIIHPSFLQHGTTSGRYSCKAPNFQNLPRDDKRVKGCIVARPGRVFVGADYSQLEPRMFAYYSKDERLLKAFEGGDDFYSVIGMEVYNKYDCTPSREELPTSFKIKYKSLRDKTKVIPLARTYGATAFQIAKTTGKSVAETQEDMDRLDEAFPGIPEMVKSFHTIAKTQGYVSNLFGRLRRIPEAKNIDKRYKNMEHSELPYEVRSVLNLAVNHPIQSSGASIINRASIAFYNNCKALGLDATISAQVHDSIVVECKEEDAETVSLLLQDAMENTTDLKTIKLEAVPKIGKTLADV